MGSGYAKFIAEYFARGERQRMSHLIATAVFTYALIGVALALIGFPLLGAAAGKLGLKPDKLDAIERGGALPSFAQIEKAADVYMCR